MLLAGKEFHSTMVRGKKLYFRVLVLQWYGMYDRFCERVVGHWPRGEVVLRGYDYKVIQHFVEHWHCFARLAIFRLCSMVCHSNLSSISVTLLVLWYHFENWCFYVAVRLCVGLTHTGRTLCAWPWAWGCTATHS